MRIDDPDDEPTIFDALDAVARDHEIELGVAPDLPGRFDARQHCGPPPDDGVERAIVIAAPPLALYASNSYVRVAQDLIEAQRNRIVVFKTALREAQAWAGIITNAFVPSST